MALINATAISSADNFEIEQSLKFEDGRSPKLAKTFASAGNRKTFTFSCWVKKNKVSGYHVLLGCGTVGDQEDIIFFDTTNNNFRFAFGNGTGYTRATAAFYKDTSAWMHVMVAVDSTQSTAADRIKMYVNGVLNTTWAASSNNDPAQNFDFRFNTAAEHYIGEFSRISASADFYLADMNFIDGQQLTPADFGETGTYGEWKPIEYSGTYGTNGFYLPFKNDYTVEGFSAITYKGNSTNRYLGGFGFKPGFIWQKTRDYGYGHHIVDAVRGSENEFYEISNATSGDEDINANGLTGFKTDGVTLGTGNGWNNSSRTQVMWAWDMGADTPTGFGCVTYKGNGANRDIENVGFKPDLVWIRERATTSNNYLIDSVRGANNVLYSDITNAEQDASGPGTTVTKFNPDGFGLGTSGGVNQSGNTNVAWCWDMGNTTVTNTSGTISSQVRANPTYGQSIVKWTGNGTTGHGLSSAPEMIIVKPINATGAWWVWHKDLSNTSQGFLQLNTTAAEATNSSLWDNASPVSATTINANTAYINYATDNYIAYCFHSVTGYSKIGSYTGNGSTTGPTVTLGFRPAFIMLKSSTQAENWNIIDNVRSPFDKYSNGSNLRNVLKANSSVAESQFGIKFTDTGFQLVTTDGECNANGQTYIYMAFAGGLDSIADHNTTGTIPSYVKANPTYGQSVVSYIGNNTAGATVGHGLSSAPEMILIKNRDLNSDWIMYHTALGNTKHLRMNLNNSAFTSALRWNNTTPSSSVFTLGSDSSVSENNDRCIAYCFHSVTGYSKFGSYTGNGSNTGPVVTTGFRPAFLLLKNTEAAGSWYIYDSVRDPADKKGQALWANNSNANTTFYERLKFTDSGFQLLHTDTDMNGNGTTYVYIAFADKREYAYWLDQSGNNNDWTSNNLTESDISVDSPSNNFCTMNPNATGSHTEPNTNTYTTTEGNLESKWTGVASAKSYATIAPTDGKWYWEFFIKTQAETSRAYVGLCEFEDCDINDTGQSGDSNYHLGVGVNSRLQAYGNEFDGVYPAPAQYDIYSIAIDWSASPSKFWFRINGGAWQGGGNPATGATPTKSYAKTVANASMMPYHGSGSGSSSNVSEIIFNFGQDSSFAGHKTAQGNQDSGGIGDFYYTPPTGFKALCTKNLPDVDVVPSEHFNTVLYSGNGSTNAISVGFKPDFVWGKDRVGTDHHHLFDILRGTNQRLISNATSAENTESNCLNSFDTNGFTLGNNPGLNANGEAHVAWNWKAATQLTKTYTVKVVSDSGNKYRFDDFGSSAVVLELSEGGTYTFDQSDSSNSGHPLRFSSTSNGSHGGGSEYTTGVTTNGTPGNSGAYTKIVVPASAPTLYYYCTAHSGMGGQANTPTTNSFSNFSGNIQSNVSANVDAGFSIVSYTGTGSDATVGHGLSKRVEFVAVKTRSHTGDWLVYYGDVTDFLKLNETNATEDLKAAWNDWEGGASTTTFSLGNNTDVNASGRTYIAYCFHSVDGYSKVGSYTGNGNADGTFVYTGFKPMMVISKYLGTEDWNIIDTKRSPHNLMEDLLKPNSNAAEIDTQIDIDFLSNGFKPRIASGFLNGNGHTITYIAFAETPFKYSNAR